MHFILVKAFYFGKRKSTPFSPFRVRISTPFSLVHQKSTPKYTFFTGPKSTWSLSASPSDPRKLDIQFFFGKKENERLSEQRTFSTTSEHNFY